jgi:hypothetical protein
MDVVPAASTSAKIVNDHIALAVDFMPAIFPVIAGESNQRWSLELDTGPPPNDLVVSLQRLVI